MKLLVLGADAEYTWKFRGSVIRELQQRGYEVTIVAAPRGDFDISKFQKSGFEFVPWDVDKISTEPTKDLSALRQLYHILQKHRPDLLFAHTLKAVIYGTILAAILRVPRRVVMIPGLGHAFRPTKGFKHWLVARVARMGYSLAFRYAHSIIFQNPDDILDLRNLGLLPSDAPVHRVFGSGVDMERFCLTPVPRSPPHFLFVGRLLADKGICEFVEAAQIVKAEIPNALFTVVGGTDVNPSSISPQTLANWQSTATINFVGHVCDPQPYYQTCTVFVLPSYREGTPRVSLEAMSTGRAIITTDVPGCRETVRDGVNGILVPAANTEQLAEAMIHLGRRHELAERMGDMSRRLCSDLYALEKVTQETVAAIDVRTGSSR